MNRERLLASKNVFTGQAVTLRIDTVEKAAGNTATREIVEHRDCIAVVVLDHENNIIMVRQFRRPAGKMLLEIPAGGMEDGEGLADCVRRELQEETGYLPETVVRLGGFYAAPGYCTEYLHIFLATNLIESHLTAEDTDEIEVVRVPVADIIGMINNGEICDAKSVAGLLQYIMNARR